MSIVYTHNNLIQLFQNIATAHFQVKGFGVGNTTEIEGIPNKQYPYMWVVPVNSSVQLNDSGEFQTINHIFQIEVFDLVKKDRSNETEVLSDCQSILLDVVKILHNENASFEVINSPTLNPYVEKYGDDVTGWYVEIEIGVPFDSNYCDIPSDVFVTPGTSGSTNPINPYLTCSTLGDCPVITSIENELENHETRIEALEAGSGGLDCDDVAACQVIIDIEQDITDINTTISNLPLNPTLAEVLTNGNATGQQDLLSDNGLAILGLYDAITSLSYNTNAIGIDNGEMRLYHSSHIHLDATYVMLKQGYMYSSQLHPTSFSTLRLDDVQSTLMNYDGIITTGVINDNTKQETFFYNNTVYASNKLEALKTSILHPTLVDINSPILTVTNGSNNINIKPIGTSGEAEIVFTRNSLLIETGNGEYNLKRTTAGSILLYTNGRRFDLSATAGGAPNITISQATGYTGINTTTPAANLDVNGTSNLNGIITLPTQTASKVLATDASKNITTITLTRSIGLTLDGQGGVITTGSKGFSLPSFNGTIISWNIKGDDATTGSIVVDIKRNGTSIVGAGNKPTITAANSATANVSGWTSTTITAGDYIEYNVDSASTFTRINLEIKVQVNI